jgi:hypothetical protein
LVNVGSKVTIGVESNYASGLDPGSTLLVMPQVHYEFIDHWMIQAGLGAESLPGKRSYLLTADRTGVRHSKPLTNLPFQIAHPFGG